MGAAYRRHWAAIVAHTGPLGDAPLLRLEAGRVCALAVEFDEATADLAAAREQRGTGKGRRPSAAQVDRLSHRMLTANTAYSETLAALMEHPEVKRLKATAAQAALLARAKAGRGGDSSQRPMPGADGGQGNRQGPDVGGGNG